MQLDSITTFLALSPNECKNIIDTASKEPLLRGEVFSSTNRQIEDQKVRAVSGTEITDDSTRQFVIGLFKGTNQLELQISDIEPVQLFRYQPGDHYNWHTDWSPNSNKKRKLSMTIQLSESSDYEGGDVEIFDGLEPRPICRTIGHATIFPSWSLHRVRPLISGTRWAMVAWATGKPFK